MMCATRSVKCWKDYESGVLAKRTEEVVGASVEGEMSLMDDWLPIQDSSLHVSYLKLGEREML